MISQTIHFEVPPGTLYDIFIDEKKHSAFTGAKAVIDTRVGGKFSVWDWYATGKNLELVPGKKIVQTWAASDWSDGAVSKVTFAFTPSSGGTDLTFTHEDVPGDGEKDIALGWNDWVS
ncbi:MAG: SRPBCC domain-containing protein, partial [Patescibacteria group bacterium]